MVSIGAGREPEIKPSFLFEKNGQLEGQYSAILCYMDGWFSRKRNGAFLLQPKFSADHPFINPVCIDIMKQARKKVKGY